MANALSAAVLWSSNMTWKLASRSTISTSALTPSLTARMGDSPFNGSPDQTLRLLTLASGAEIGRLPAGADWIRGAAYDPQGQTLVTNDTQYLSSWDLETGEDIWNSTPDTAFWEITMSPDGKRVLAGGWGGFVGVYDAASGEMLTSLESDGSFVGHDPACGWIASPSIRMGNSPVLDLR